MKRAIAQIVITLFLGGLVRADQTIHSVQQALKDQGLYYGNVTGDKNTETAAAIRRYQIRSGLQVTGEINPETLQSLNLNSGSKAVASSQPASKPAAAQPNNGRLNDNPKVEQNSASSSATEHDRQFDTNTSYSSAYYKSVSPGMSKRMAIAELQRQLIARGYYRGPADGSYGRRTALALRAFQFDSGLPPSAQLDTGTLQTLGLSDANLVNSQPASRSYEMREPVWKLKHGKWKLKWAKHPAHKADDYGGGQPPQQADAWWNGYNQDE